MQTRLSKIYFIFFIIVVSSIFLSAVISQQYFISGINSDYLYPFETVANVIKSKTIAGQNVPSAPYFFPDLFLIMLLNMATHNIALLHYCYSILFLTVYFILVFRLLFHLVHSAYSAAMGTFIAFVQTFFVVAPGFNFLREWPGSHLSIILFALWFLVLYLRDREKGFTGQQYLLFFFLYYAIFISDNLFFAQFLFPLAIMIIYDTLKRQVHFKTATLLLGMILFVVVAGAKLDIFLTKFFGLTYSNNPNLFRIRHFTHLPETFTNIMHFFKYSFQEHTWAYINLLFDIVLCVFAIKYCQKQRKLMAILFFFCVAIISNFLLAWCAEKLTDRAHLRYLATLYFFPPIGAAAWFAYCHKIGSISSRNFLIFWLIILFFSGGMLYQPIVALQEFDLNPPYNQAIACIDHLSHQYAIKNGLGQYWYVRPIRMLSREGIGMAQINSELQFFNFIDNRMHFSPRPYQFIIVNQLSQQKIKKAFGEPDKIAVCPGQEVWLYLKSSGNSKLNHFLASPLAKQNLGV